MLELLIGGIVSGSLYVAMGSGVVVLRRYVGTINFAQGAVGSLAAFVAYGLISDGWSYWAAAAAAVASGALLSMAIGEVVSAFFGTATELRRSIATLGPWLVMIGVLSIVWGNTELGLAGPPGTAGVVAIAGVRVSVLAGISVVGTLLGIGGLDWLVRHTGQGVVLRAIADSRAVAAVNGINVRQYERVVWAAGGCLGGVAGLVITAQNTLDPQFLTTFMIAAFTAAVLGGLSDLRGLIGGGLVLGIVLAVLEYFLPGQVLSIGSVIVLVLVLWVRPQGLFSGARRQEVGSEPLRLGHPMGTVAVASGLARMATLAGAYRGLSVTRRSRAVVWTGLAILGLLLVPLIAPSPLVFVLSGTAAFSIAIAGQNVISGYSGQVSMAQGGLMLVGGYAAGILVASRGIEPVFGLIASALIAMGTGVVVSVGVMRLGGIYLGIVTLSLDLALTSAAYDWSGVTKGDMGVTMPGLRLGGVALSGTNATYYASVFVALVCLVGLSFVVRRRVGLRWRAARDSAKGAAAGGIVVWWVRVLAFAVGGAAAGVAGALSSYQSGVIAPTSFGLYTAIYILLASAIGGEESMVWGPVVGAAFITVVPFILNETGGLVDVIFGAATLASLVAREVLQSSRRQMATATLGMS